MYRATICTLRLIPALHYYALYIVYSKRLSYTILVADSKNCLVHSMQPLYILYYIACLFYVCLCLCSKYMLIIIVIISTDIIIIIIIII